MTAFRAELTQEQAWQREGRFHSGPAGLHQFGITLGHRASHHYQ